MIKFENVEVLKGAKGQPDIMRISYCHRIEIAALVLFISAFAAGCAMVEDIQSDGSVRRAIALGVITMPDIPQDRGRVVKVNGAGLEVDQSGFTFGYFNKLQVVPDPECQAVLIGSTEEQLKHFAELIPKTGLCGDGGFYGEKK